MLYEQLAQIAWEEYTDCKSYSTLQYARLPGRFLNQLIVIVVHLFPMKTWSFSWNDVLQTDCSFICFTSEYIGFCPQWENPKRGSREQKTVLIQFMLNKFQSNLSRDSAKLYPRSLPLCFQLVFRTSLRPRRNIGKTCRSVWFTSGYLSEVRVDVKHWMGKWVQLSGLEGSWI